MCRPIKTPDIHPPMKSTPHPAPRNLARGIASLAVLCVLFPLPAQTAPAIPDLYSTSPGKGGPDTLCDAWQLVYNAWGLRPDADDDKDGSSNYAESVNGTDPRNARDYLRNVLTRISSAGIEFTFNARAGKCYRIVSDKAASGTFENAEKLISPVAGCSEFIAPKDNPNQTLRVAADLSKPKIYRLEVTDADSDGDGLSDWAELRTGTDPKVASSSSNACGGVASDAEVFNTVLALAESDRAILSLLKPRKTGQSSAPENSRYYSKVITSLAQAGRLTSTSAGITRGDFNGDGFADLAVGIPRESPAGASGAGAVVVIYGSANGLAASGSSVPAAQFWSQGSAGISGANETGDRFGTALAAGEFNGDAFSDLAIGVPGEDITVNGTAHPNTGRVVVIYGSPTGLSASGTSMVHPSQSFDLASGTPPAVITGLITADIFPDNAKVGQSLAWGDFNGDSIGDLAIGAPNMSVKSNMALTLFADSEAGQVWILFGSLRNGLVRAGSQLVTQLGNLPGIIVGGMMTGWHNGASLAAGDFNGDSITDLVVGAPDASFGGKEQIGMATVFPGVAGVGLDWGRGRLFSTGNVGIDGESGDHFGFSFASGDFDRDGLDDLAIGMPHQPGRRIRNSDGSITVRESSAGRVFVRFGDRTNLLHPRDVQSFDQNDLFGSGREAGDRFGHSLAAGDFNGDSFVDLAIGVPGEDLAGGRDAGEVNVVYGSSAGLSTSLSRAPQRFGDVSAQAGAQFGRSLSAWNFGRNQSIVLPGINLRLTLRTADLAVGVPFKDFAGKEDAGAMHVFYGTADGLTLSGEQEWTKDTPGVPGTAKAGDFFGMAGY